MKPLLVFGRIQTLDPAVGSAEAMACLDGHIIKCGSRSALSEEFPDAVQLDLQSHWVYPGFIDPHCHFVYHGLEKEKLNLRGIGSSLELLDCIRSAALTTASPWILGRGWNQEKWPDLKLPTLQELDAAVPDRPLMLSRIDGHAALVNSLALRKSGLMSAPKIKGGTVVQQKGNATGLLIDKAMDLVFDCMPAPTFAQIKMAVQKAQEECFSFGLTSVHDAGLDVRMFQHLSALEEEGILQMSVYQMLNPDESTRSYFAEKGPYKSGKLHCRSFKYYADGALGSRGARMLEPYSDLVDHSENAIEANDRGLWLCEAPYLQQQAIMNAEQGFQMNTHAIGDAANRLILDTYGKATTSINDHRWRIEHAQIVHESDVNKFGLFGVIPSVQSTHATSDRDWVAKRIGKERLKGAYALRTLLNQNGWLANGSDFPIESADPLDGFYTAVFRKDRGDLYGQPFLATEAISRRQALLAMTEWAAKAAFEEGERGVLRPGMKADFVALNADLENADEQSLRSAEVQLTAVGGKVVYSGLTE